MADRLKDPEDLKLEALFRNEPIPDDGFSRRVVTRMRRRIWVRRLTMPAAVLVGGLIAARPAADLLVAGYRLLDVLPRRYTTAAFPEIPADLLPQVPVLLVGVFLVTAALLLVRALED